jgi:hypothetical protein
VQGESTAQGWELVGSLGQTTFSVGSGSQSTWQVRGEGVQPLHFTLHWDGTILRVADLANHGDVRVDGVRVGSAWHPLMGHARLEFGCAAMMVDSSAARASDSDHPLEPASRRQVPCQRASRTQPRAPCRAYTRRPSWASPASTSRTSRT